MSEHAESGRSLGDLGTAVRNHVREHNAGMAVDLAFALAWVTLVTLLFEVVQGPSWAYQLTLASGVVAYYGFFASLSVAKARQ
ncbi:hypothetical protein [Haloarchaeobius sp. HME9146]|uniref:hypothetical protein n=1 Tax=Haloarchaeobius sp. HME9146 TaxID=2978732 RepID=UPI0021C0248B|nr:hypothetical protein [Haloarchaeobius sp. HME9146]MCT9098295.1 hypothetical protein [Haloarchaeobius sp. HME9146]